MKSILCVLTLVATMSAQTVVENLRLASSAMQVLDYATDVSTGCDGFDCSSFTPLFPPFTVVCPTIQGDKCVFQVQVHAALNLTGPIALIHYAGNGDTLANNSNTQFQWTDQGDKLIAYSFPVIWTNRVANDIASIEVDIGCEAQLTDACNVRTHTQSVYDEAANLRVDVFISPTPPQNVVPASVTKPSNLPAHRPLFAPRRISQRASVPR